MNIDYLNRVGTAHKNFKTHEMRLNEENQNLKLEIERLNNIINELEEWLYGNTNYEEYDRVEKDTFNYVIKKIEELRNEEK